MISCHIIISQHVIVTMKTGQDAYVSVIEYHDLLPTGSEEREVLGFGSIPVAIFPSYQYMKKLHHNYFDPS